MDVRFLPSFVPSFLGLFLCGENENVKGGRDAKTCGSTQRESLGVNVGFRGPLGQMLLFHVCFDQEPL